MESSNLRSTSTTDAQQSKPSNKKVYYPCASNNSPDLSYLPLPPRLDRPATLRLIPTGTTTTTTTIPPIVSALAFELSTPAALLQSIHFYFADHLGTNIALGLHPTFDDKVSLLSTRESFVPSATGRLTIRETNDTYTMFGALSSGEGADSYVLNFRHQAAVGRLRGVIVYVDWEMGEQAEREARVARVVRMARMERQAARRALRHI